MPCTWLSSRIFPMCSRSLVGIWAKNKDMLSSAYAIHSTEYASGTSCAGLGSAGAPGRALTAKDPLMLPELFPGEPGKASLHLLYLR
jgi:hypothetical protein